MRTSWLAASRTAWMAALVTSGTLALGCIFTSTRPGTGEPEALGSGAPSVASAAASAEPTALASAEPSADPDASTPPTSSGVVSTEPPPCTTTPPNLKPPEAEIVLIDAGKEPRRALRYVPRTGLRRTVTYSLQSSMVTEQGGERRQQQGMGFSLTVDGRIGKPEKGTDDQIRYEFKATKLDVPDVKGMPPEFNRAVREQLSAWKSAKGTVLIDSRGMTQSVKLDGDSKTMGRVHDIRVALEQTANPLPEEPVGLGAKWEVVTVVDTGLVLRGHTIFELVALEGDKGKVRFTIDQRSDPKPGPAVCPQPNVVVQPISWVATGTGERTFNLGELLAGAYQTKLQVHNVSRTYVTGEGQVQMADANVDVELETRMTAK